VILGLHGGPEGRLHSVSQSLEFVGDFINIFKGNKMKEQFGINELRESISKSIIGKLPGVQPGRTQTEFLRGLKGFYVSVEHFSTEVKKYGLLSQNIQIQTELQLHQNGIRVLTINELHKRYQAFIEGGFKRMDAAAFYVNVNIGIDEEVGDAAVNINLQVVQPAFLPREQDIVFGDTTTWQNGYVCLYDLNMINRLPESVKKRVDIFINDYLAANPKQTER